MGWTGMHRPKGETDRAFFEHELPFTLGKHGRIVECATVANVFYAAVKNNDDAPFYPGLTWALVVLMQRGRGEFNFHYKELDETMGPAEDRCPERILDLLSPTDHHWAAPWRERCRAYHAARKAKGTIRVGEWVRFTAPENLTALGVCTRVDSRAGLFRSHGTGVTHRITWWRTATWEIVHNPNPEGIKTYA